MKVKEHYIHCKDRCSSLSFVKYEYEEDYFINFYVNYFPAKKKLLKRIWEAITNKNSSSMGIVCSKEDIDNLKQFLESGI